MKFKPVEHLGYLFSLLLLAVALTVIYGHFRDSDNNYPKLEVDEFTLVEQDAESPGNHPLITQRKDYEYELTFSRDNSGKAIFSPFSSSQISYLFKYLFSKNRGVPCKASSRKDQPFLLNVDINGEQYSHRSISGKVASVEFLLSANDNVAITFDGQTNTCGAAYLILYRKADYPVTLLVVVVLAWLAFIGACGYYRKFALPGFAIVMLVILSEAELRGPVLILTPAFLGLTLAPIFAASFVAFLSSLRTRTTGFAWALLLIFSITSILAFVTLPVVVIGFEKMFDQAIDQFDWFAIFQTDPTETSEFMLIFAPVKTISTHAMVIMGLLLLGIRRHILPGRISISVSLLGSLVSLSLTAVLLGQTTAIQQPLDAFLQYQADRRYMTEALQDRATRFSDAISAQKLEQDEIYIIVLGESANKYHFSIYNYPRNTNPRLLERMNRGELIVQKNGYSSGRSTSGTLPYALTTSYLDSDTPPSKSPAIMEILNLSGIETHWIHNGGTSIRKSTVSIIAEQARHVNHMLSTLGEEDGKLIAEVKKLVDSSRPGTKVIFLKTQGSHIDYCERIDHDPVTWNFNDPEFDDWLVPNQFPASKVSASASCYDGSILYTDYVVDQLIELVETLPTPAAVVYFSDHGDDVIRGTSHMKNASFDVFNMPMFTFFSPGYLSRYPGKVANMKANSKRLFVNDQIFDTVMGITGVTTNVRDPESDLTSSEFSGHILIDRGRKSIFDPDNYEYRTREKISALLHAAPGQTMPLLSLGRISHPFHLAYINGPGGYPFVALDIDEQDGRFWVGSRPQDKILLASATGYFKLGQTQDLFINYSSSQDATGSPGANAQKLVTALSALNCRNQCKLTVSTKRIELGLELQDLGIPVSIIFDRLAPVTGLRIFDNITINEDDLAELPAELAQKQLTLTNMDCDFLSCDFGELRKRLDRLQGKASAQNIHRIVTAVHNL